MITNKIEAELLQTINYDSGLFNFEALDSTLRGALFSLVEGAHADTHLHVIVLFLLVVVEEVY